MSPQARREQVGVVDTDEARRIARDADLELPVTEFAGSAQWLIEAESGSRRPRIRFRPSAFAAKSNEYATGDSPFIPCSTKAEVAT